jgi:hypothetical protein
VRPQYNSAVPRPDRQAGLGPAVRRQCPVQLVHGSPKLRERVGKGPGADPVGPSLDRRFPTGPLCLGALTHHAPSRDSAQQTGFHQRRRSYCHSQTTQDRQPSLWTPFRTLPRRMPCSPMYWRRTVATRQLMRILAPNFINHPPYLQSCSMSIRLWLCSKAAEFTQSNDIGSGRRGSISSHLTAKLSRLPSTLWNRFTQAPSLIEELSRRAQDRDQITAKKLILRTSQVCHREPGRHSNGPPA